MDNIQTKIAMSNRESRILRKKARSYRNAARREALAQKPNHVNSLNRDLAHHERTCVLRPKLRAMHLAHAFLKGKSYGVVEDSSCRTPVDTHLVSHYINVTARQMDVVERHVKEWITS